MRTCLAEQYEFDAGAMYMTGRDAFLAQAAYPPQAVTRMVGDAYQGSVGFQLYESRNGAASVRIAEQLLVEEGRIAASVVVTDMSSVQRAGVSCSGGTSW